MYNRFYIFILLLFILQPCFSEPLICDVCVVGDGNGGFGAALAAARAGAKVFVDSREARRYAAALDVKQCLAKIPRNASKNPDAAGSGS